MLEKLLIKVGRHPWACEVRDAATNERLDNLTRLTIDVDANRMDSLCSVTITLLCEVDIEAETGELVRHRLTPGGMLEEIDRIAVGA